MMGVMVKKRMISKPHKLEGKEYEKFRTKVFERDNWKCRNVFCGSRKNLTPHHYIKRSKVRLDTMENVITLCISCHIKVHERMLEIIKVGENLYKFQDKKCLKNFVKA